MSWNPDGWQPDGWQPDGWQPDTPGSEQAEAPVVTFPNLPIRSFRIELNERKALSESLFTRKRQVVSLSGGTADFWEGVITTPPLFPMQVREMMNFLVETGVGGQFTMLHPDYQGPASGAENGTVDGSGQRGTTLDVVFSEANTKVLLEGEWFQVEEQFFRATEDATTDGDGKVSLTFRPAIRIPPGNGHEVHINFPVMTLELTSLPPEDTDHIGVQAFTLSFRQKMFG